MMIFTLVYYLQSFLMEFSIYDAIQNGFDQIVIITKKETQEFLKDHLSKKLNGSIKLDVIAQEINDLPENYSCSKSRTKPWGTAHAVWCARDYVDTDFAIINADDYYGSTALEKAARFFNRSDDQNNYGLVSYKLKNTLSEFGSVSRGVCKVSNGKLDSINEHLKIEKNKNTIVDHDSGNILSEKDYVSMNFWLCRSNFFNHLEEYIAEEIGNLDDIEKSEIYLPFAAQKLLSENIINVDVVDSDSKWFGVTYKEDKDNSVKKLASYTREGIYPTPLWS